MGAKSIHTMGMNFPIDLVFLDERMRILAFESQVMPGCKKKKGPSGTKSILELGEGSILAHYKDIPIYAKLESEVVVG